jgi:hypothetical protein
MNQNAKNVFNFSKLPYLLGFSLFVYVSLRIFMVAMTDDEALTVHYYVNENWWGILTATNADEGWAGNNHVLNTLFMKAEMGIFGKHEWAMRLHILLSFAVAFYFTLRIIEQITPHPIRQFAYLCFIFLNPYLLDFFGLARGYAISIAAWSYTFYYFYQYTKNNNLSHLVHVLIGLFIGVWGNFSFLYLAFFLGLMLLHAFYDTKSARFDWTHFTYTVFAYVSIAVVNAIPLYKTIISHRAYGGTIGLFQDTAVIGVERFIHSNEKIERFGKFTDTWTYLESAAAIILAIFAIIHVLNLLLKTNRPNLKRLYFMALFQTIGVAILVKILFITTQSPYPMGRTALLFSFPFLVSTIAAVDILLERFQKLAYIFILILPILTWHFSECYNLRNTREWWLIGDAKNAISYMKDHLGSQNLSKIAQLGAESSQFHPLDFYATPELDSVLHVEFTDLTKTETFDYLFVSIFRKNEVPKNFEPLKEFKKGILFKKKS